MGEIDVQPAAETAVEKAYVVLDLTGLDAISSLGIDVIVRSTKALRMRGGEAVIVSTVPGVTMLFEHTRILDVIETFGDLESACRALPVSI